MKRVVSAEQMRDYEQKRFSDGREESLEWMERAAQGVDALLKSRYAEASVLAVCGGGNNGGDGFALLRLLKLRGVDCAGVLLADAGSLSGDAKTNYLSALDCGVHFFSAFNETLLAQYGVLVDAMFGTGLSRPIGGTFADAIEWINASGKPVVAIDLPSGVDATSGAILGIAIRASETVTFQFYKRGQLLYPGRAQCGEITLHPLTTEQDEEPPLVSLIERADVARLLPARPADSHKGKNGRALLCVGSGRYTGAALLSVGAALRAGAGLTTAAIPGALKQAFSVLPEAMAACVNNGGDWDSQGCAKAALLLAQKNAVCIGPGVGEGNILPLIDATLESRIPAVLDADALNQLSKAPELMQKLHPDVVLTPHPVEMTRLCGETLEDIINNPIEIAQTYAKKWNCVLLLKGATSCISNGSEVRLNTSGNAGLAKGGSGDVLSGLVTALLAQGLRAMDAASAGAYLLGASADTAFELLKERMLLARDVIGAVEQTIVSL